MTGEVCGNRLRGWFGRYLRRHRQMMGMSVSEMEGYLSLPKGTLPQLEQGVVLPDAMMARHVGRVLGARSDVLELAAGYLPEPTLAALNRQELDPEAIANMLVRLQNPTMTEIVVAEGPARPTGCPVGEEKQDSVV